MSETETDLPVRPAQNREGQYHTIEVGRGSEAGTISVTSTELFRRSLPPDLQDSWNEIGAGPYALQTDYLGIRQFLYGRITIGSGDDLSTYMLDLKARYCKWREIMDKQDPATISLCHDICHLQESLRASAKARHRRYEAIKRQFLFGLMEYSSINKMHLKYIR